MQTQNTEKLGLVFDFAAAKPATRQEYVFINQYLESVRYGNCRDTDIIFELIFLSVGLTKHKMSYVIYNVFFPL